MAHSSLRLFGVRGRMSAMDLDCSSPGTGRYPFSAPAVRPRMSCFVGST